MSTDNAVVILEERIKDLEDRVAELEDREQAALVHVPLEEE